VAYSPLGRGFLTGRFRRFKDIPEGDWRHSSPRFQGENFQKNLTIVDRVGEIAREKSVKPSQIALAWLLAKGEDIVPIPGTTRRDHLEENIAALAIVLTPEDLSRIEALIPINAASGQRYNETGMRNVNG
jgi:aryl-alcohol dehydrogenase-like predicted oxidoreductase